MHNLKRLALGAVAVVFVATGALAVISTTTKYWKIERENTLFLADVGIGSDGSLEVDGTTTLDGTTTINGAISGTTVTASGSLAVTGAATFASTVAVTGTLTGIGTISAEQLTTTDDLTVTGLATIGETLAVTGTTDAGTTLTCVDFITNSKSLVGIYRYSADPNNTTATLTATGVRAGDWVVGGCQSGAANGTFKALEGATPGTDIITLQWEVDPGAVVTHSFMVWR
jgi:cytoskeletal protein CcmA (bactofilin family)